MTIELTISPKGVLTLGQDVLDHLGIERGGKLDMALLPNGRLELSFAGGREDTESARSKRRLRVDAGPFWAKLKR
jgi:hypothetical protein